MTKDQSVWWLEES